MQSDILDDEKDLLLKIRMMRLHWWTNHFVTHDVNLYNFDIAQGRRDTYTDIDVICINFNSMLQKRIIICDCKSGNTIKEKNRIFWLSGLMNIIDIDDCYFVKTDIAHNQVYQLADKTNIRLISDKLLSNLEKIFNVNEDEYIGPFDIKNIENINKIYKSLKKNHYKEYLYFSDLYWYDDLYSQIKKLYEIMQKIKSYGYKEGGYAEKDIVNHYLIFYILSLFSISCLEFANKLIFVEKEKQNDYIYDCLIRGNPYIVQNIDIYTKFYNFMVGEIKTRYGKKYPISKKEFLSFLKIGYLDNIIDLIQRIGNYSLFASSLPQIFQLAAYDLFNSKDKFNWDYIPNINNMEKTKKLVNDFLVFLIREKIIESKNYENYISFFNIE